MFLGQFNVSWKNFGSEVCYNVGAADVIWYEDQKKTTWIFRIYFLFFRMNRKRTKYTGAICGLGSDDTGGPILPDHDIEVVFDIHFDNDDISLVSWQSSVCT